MNKFDLVEEIVSKTGAVHKDAEEIVDTAFDLIIAHLLKREEVKITGFGTFEVKERQARNGTNPKTGVKINIPASTSIGFRPSKKVKARL